MNIEIGRGKSDITILKIGNSMLGYGQIFNTAETIKTRLYSRAIAFKDGNIIFVFVCVDLCFVTPILKRKIMECLNHKFNKPNLIAPQIFVTAQHTHSAPSGFSEYGMYNLPTPGFHFDVVDYLGEKIAESISIACDNFVKGQLFIEKSVFANEIPVGFNRAIESYNKNPEVSKVTDSERNLAIDREMTLLLCKDENSENIASINWFGVHTTSMSNDNHALHFDNKGYACEYIEDYFSKQNHIGIFAQGSCGDVSPKFKYNPKRSSIRGYYEGMFPDDDESAAYNGKLQFEKALEIVHSIEDKKNQIVNVNTNENSIDFIESWIDFSKVKIDEDRCTSKACVGLAFLMGVKMDGPGAPMIVKILCEILFPIIKYNELFVSLFKSKELRAEIVTKYKVQGKKIIMIEPAERRLLGTRNVSKLILPGWFDEFVSTFKHYHKTGALDDISWTPQVLPLNIVRLKNIIFIGIPFEITTIASKRLKIAMQNVFPNNEVIICPYTNAYAAYVTTPEEFENQMYEGGHSYFGKWTLDALILKCVSLGEEFKKPKEERSPQKDKEPIITETHLRKWATFETKWWKKRKKLINK